MALQEVMRLDRRLRRSGPSENCTSSRALPVRALQADGGSEFAPAFEQACQKRGLRLFMLPARSPKLNWAVERAQRTHTEEFYEVFPPSLEVARLTRELRQ